MTVQLEIGRGRDPNRARPLKVRAIDPPPGVIRWGMRTWALVDAGARRYREIFTVDVRAPELAPSRPAVPNVRRAVLRPWSSVDRVVEVLPFEDVPACIVHDGRAFLSTADRTPDGTVYTEASLFIVGPLDFAPPPVRNRLRDDTSR